MVNFCEFLRPVFSGSRVQHISDLQSKFALRPHHVWNYGRQSNQRPLRIGEGKKEERKKKETTAAKYNGLPY